MRNLLDKNITWGGYLKMCGISLLLAIPCYIIGLIYSGVIDNPIDCIKDKMNHD